MSVNHTELDQDQQHYHKSHLGFRAIISRRNGRRPKQLRSGLKNNLRFCPLLFSPAGGHENRQSHFVPGGFRDLDGGAEVLGQQPGK